MRSTAETLRKEDRARGQIVSPSASDAIVGKAVSSAAPLVRLSRVFGRLADELASGRAGPAYSLVASGDRLIAQGRRSWSFAQRRLLVLDGTACGAGKADAAVLHLSSAWGMAGEGRLSATGASAETSLP